MWDFDDCFASYSIQSTLLDDTTVECGLELRSCLCLFFTSANRPIAFILLWLSRHNVAFQNVIFCRTMTKAIDDRTTLPVAFFHFQWLHAPGLRANYRSATFGPDPTWLKPKTQTHRAREIIMHDTLLHPMPHFEMLIR